VVAQVPGIHPDPAALEAWQLDEGLEWELRQARAAVAEARQAALAAKSELEAAAKSAAQARQINDADATSPSQSPQSEPQPQDGSVAGVKILKRLISELQAERMELLAHLTARHPLILDADMRLEEYRRQLAGLSSSGPTESNDLASDSALKIVVEEQRTSEVTSTPQADQPAALTNQPSAENSLRLEQALATWQAAQTDLDAALDRESATADRIAALVARHASNRRKSPAPQTTVEPAADVAVAAAPPQSPPSDSAPRGSGPLVLAAIVIAISIAAVASIKLARATDQTIFSGADDAAATLSLPVVGVIPAGSAAAAHGSILQRHRTVAFLIQVLAAVAVFALVALMVQNPGAVWQFLSAALESSR
jgi:hypothetical protein